MKKIIPLLIFFCALFFSRAGSQTLNCSIFCSPPVESKQNATSLIPNCDTICVGGTVTYCTEEYAGAIYGWSVIGSGVQIVGPRNERCVTIQGTSPGTYQVCLVKSVNGYQNCCVCKTIVVVPCGPANCCPPCTLVIVATFYVLLNKTRLGRGVGATGANIQAARLSGIAVNRCRLIALSLSGLGAAMGGVMLTARLGTGQSGAGDAYLLDSLTAVFLGMTVFKPGRATVQGTLVGVVIIGMLDNGLNLLGAPFYLQNEVRGLVMIAAVSLAVLRSEIRFF